MASKGKRLTAAAELFEQDLGGSIRKILLTKIKPNEHQPRKEVSVNIQNLADSLKDDGLLQPIVVTKTGDTFKIIAGERRFHAATRLGWKEIECRILNKNEKDTYRLAVIENIQRENLNPFEEADAFLRLKVKFEYTDSELSKILGKSRNYISEILSITELSGNNREMAKAEGISSTNMLIQLAIASKKGRGNAFFDAYRSKDITSVRAAKAFNKENNPIQPLQIIEKPKLKVSLLTKLDFTINPTVKNDKPQITIDFTTNTISKGQLKVLIAKLETILLATKKE